MSDGQPQVQRERTRRSLRTEIDTPPVVTSDAYVRTQDDLEQIDDIINTIVNPTEGQPTVPLGEDRPHDVDAERLSNEERVRQFRQQGGQ